MEKRRTATSPVVEVSDARLELFLEAEMLTDTEHKRLDDIIPSGDAAWLTVTGKRTLSTSYDDIFRVIPERLYNTREQWRLISSEREEHSYASGFAIGRVIDHIEREVSRRKPDLSVISADRLWKNLEELSRFPYERDFESRAAALIAIPSFVVCFNSWHTYCLPQYSQMEWNVDSFTNYKEEGRFAIEAAMTLGHELFHAVEPTIREWLDEGQDETVREDTVVEFIRITDQRYNRHALDYGVHTAEAYAARLYTESDIATRYAPLIAELEKSVKFGQAFEFVPVSGAAKNLGIREDLVY